MSATNLPIGPEGKVNKAYQVSSWPTHVLIDAEGNLRCLGRFFSGNGGPRGHATRG